VLGVAASRAGLVLLFLSLGWTAGSLIAGRWVNRRGYRTVATSGMVLLTLGYGIFLAPRVGLGSLAVIVSGIAIGIGMGLANLTTLVAAQTTVSMSRIGVATSTIMLFRTFGGAFAVSLMGTVMLSFMQRGLSRFKSSSTTVPPSIWEKLANPQNLLEPATRAQISPEMLPKMIEALSDALWYAFLTGCILMFAGVVISLFMPDYTPASTPKPQGSTQAKH
jgi:hypothetical protein